MLNTIAYIASAFILFSFTLKDQKKLRIFNSIGAILFIFYSYMKADYPDMPQTYQDQTGWY